MVGSSGFRESWNIGNNEIASYGKAGELTASFNQGVVDTLSGQAESAVKTVRNPGKALKKVGADYVSYGKKNPANFLPSNYIGAKIVDGFVNQCRNSYNLGLNYGLNGVAYGLGQETTIVAETGTMAYGSQMLTNALCSSQKGLNWDIVKGNGETRFQHVAKHMSNNLQKPNHGVFYGDAVSTINEAWEIGLNQGIQPITAGNVDKYFIPYPNAGYAGGYAGQGNNLGYVTIITKTNTNQIITGYPSGLG